MLLGGAARGERFVEHRNALRLVRAVAVTREPAERHVDEREREQRRAIGDRVLVLELERRARALGHTRRRERRGLAQAQNVALDPELEDACVGAHDRCELERAELEPNGVLGAAQLRLARAREQLARHERHDEAAVRLALLGDQREFGAHHVAAAALGDALREVLQIDEALRELTLGHARPPPLEHKVHVALLLRTLKRTPVGLKLVAVDGERLREVEVEFGRRLAQRWRAQRRAAAEVHHVAPNPHVDDRAVAHERLRSCKLAHIDADRVRRGHGELNAP